MNILDRYVYVNNGMLRCSFCNAIIFGHGYIVKNIETPGNNLIFHILEYHCDNDFIERRRFSGINLLFKFSRGYFEYFHHIIAQAPQLLFIAPVNISELDQAYGKVETASDSEAVPWTYDPNTFYRTVGELNFKCAICKIAYDCGFPAFDTVENHLQKECSVKK